MKIGIDGRMWDQSGIGRYIRNLVTHLGQIDKKNTYSIFLLSKNLDLKLPKNFTKVKADFGWYTFEEQIKFPGLIKKHQVDLMHFPHFNIPIFYSGKFVVTIHDLIHQHFGTAQSSTLNPISYRFKKYIYQGVFSDALVKSSKIITPSEFVKQQLITEWRIKPDKVTVTPEAVDEAIFQLKKSTSKPEIESPYLFYVGNAHPHKNIAKLISIFQQVKIIHPELKLVLAGKENYFWRQAIEGSNMTDVDYLGYVTDAQMVALYQNALAFVMPSLEEGFGIPILEAMATGCPVMASDIGVLKEVGGDAAFFFVPTDDEDFRSKLLQVIGNPRLRSILKQKGLKRVKDFSWERLARQTLEVYQSAG